MTDDISGVRIAIDVRLLVPDDGSDATFWHRVDDEEWCETPVPRDTVTGGWDSGDLAVSEFTCSGGHLTGSVTDGQWEAS
jgi:hypothetical protein